MYDVVGVDFSGAVDAGRRIWIAEAHVLGEYLSVRACYPARELPGSGTARDQALSALCELIASRPGTTFGIDAPLGLPAAVAGTDWHTLVQTFGSRYADAEAFKAAALAAGGGRELKRRTDRETATPFSAYNLRMYRQTFYALRDVVGPLKGRASVLPMDAPAPGQAQLVEVCPASTLAANGLGISYKGRTEAHRRGRRALVEWLVSSTPAAIPAAIRDLVVGDTGGDAVDALVAASAAGRAVSVPRPQETEYLLEGFVYL
ncbi:MAG TPA: DUF429 domain-containing protein [Gaiellaceae bacterium]|nr:DUF429 domain-containing protein [Gaiellaceae bacterium]